MLHVFLTLNNLADPCLEKSRLVLDRTVLRSEADSQMHKDHQPPGFPAWSACSDHSVARASWSRMVPARKDRQHPEIFHRSIPVWKRWDHQPPDQDCRSLGLAFPPSFNKRLLSVGSLRIASRLRWLPGPTNTTAHRYADPAEQIADHQLPGFERWSDHFVHLCP